MRMFFRTLLEVLRVFLYGKDVDQGMSISQLMKLNHPFRVFSDNPALGSIVTFIGGLTGITVFMVTLPFIIEVFPFLAVMGGFAGVMASLFLLCLFCDTVMLWNLKYTGAVLQSRRLLFSKNYPVSKPAPSWMTRMVAPLKEMDFTDQHSLYDHGKRINLIVMSAIQQARSIEPVTPLGQIPLAAYLTHLSRATKYKDRIPFALACQSHNIDPVKAREMRLAGVISSEVNSLVDIPLETILHLYPYPTDSEKRYPKDIL